MYFSGTMKGKYQNSAYTSPPQTFGADDDEPQSTIDGVFNPEDLEDLSIVNGTPEYSRRTNERYVRRDQKPCSEEEELERILKEEGINLPDVDD
jgi:hypothetical protein